MNKYDKEVIFYIPGAFIQPGVIINYFLKNYRDNRYMFCDNAEIGCIYGAPGAIWNGGHYVGGLISYSELQKYKYELEQLDIPIRFTFSNCLLEEKHLYDIYSNDLTDMFATGKNEIICNSPLLENYLRKRYRNLYKYISSTTKCLENTDNQLNELNQHYYLTVLDIDHNRNFDLISKLDNVSNIELLCNSTCQDNCPQKKEHYKLISQMQLSYGILDNGEEDINCPWSESSLYQRMEHKNFITPEDINDIYIPYGFKHFKLEGRCSPPLEWIETVTYYLVKDKYQMRFRQDMSRLLYSTK